MNLNDNKKIIKNIIYSLIDGNTKNVNIFELPTVLNNENSIKIEEFKIYPSLMKQYKQDYIQVEEIISNIQDQYLEYIINFLVDNEIILLNIYSS